jgi:hypothetical protein
MEGGESERHGLGLEGSQVLPDGQPATFESHGQDALSACRLSTSVWATLALQPLVQGIKYGLIGILSCLVLTGKD